MLALGGWVCQESSDAGGAVVLKMMFESAPDDESGLEYMEQYVAGCLGAGRSEAEVAEAFGIPSTWATAEQNLPRRLLSWTRHVQDASLSKELCALARAGHVDEALAVLAAGAPWDAVDAEGHSAGSYALRGGHVELAEALVAAGASCILQEAERSASRAGEAADAADCFTAGEHARYLADSLAYEEAEGRLMDSRRRPVMMEWERSLMNAHAAAMLPESGGGAALNIGFGLGLVDAALQARRPARHHIVEAHPDVLARMAELGWAERPGVCVHAGRWQDVLPRICAQIARGELAPFSCLMFDTFAEGADQLLALHDRLPT